MTYGGRFVPDGHKKVMPAVLQRLARHGHISTTMAFYVALCADDWRGLMGPPRGYWQHSWQHWPRNDKGARVANHT